MTDEWRAVKTRVYVTSAQVAAAKAMVRRWEQTRRPVREAVRKIAEARR